MQIPILVEPLPDGRGFRAKAGEPFGITAESPDRAGAINEVRRHLDDLVVAGKVVAVNIGSANSMAKLIGTLDMTDPRAQQWWENVEQFRRECETITFPGEGTEDGA
jgi:hypothetical protein